MMNQMFQDTFYVIDLCRRTTKVVLEIYFLPIMFMSHYICVEVLYIDIILFANLSWNKLGEFTQENIDFSQFELCILALKNLSKKLFGI